MPFDNLRGLLEARARRHPDHEYAHFPDTGDTLTLGRLLGNALRLARFLAERGVVRGERVAYLLPNGLQSVQLFIGIQAAGAIAVPLSLLAQPRQLAFIFEHARVRVVFAGLEQVETLNAARELAHRPPSLIPLDPDSPAQWERQEETGHTREAWPWPTPHSEDDSLLMYTSGTTGHPKGVRLTHGNLIAGARYVSEAHELGADDRVLAILPLYHINAQVVTVLAPLWHGGSLVMPRRFSASAFWKQAAEGACTWLNVVPTIVAYLLAGSDDEHHISPGEKQPTSLRFCRSASAPLPPDHQRAFEYRFGIGIIETLGLTETAAPCLTNPLDPPLRRIGSPGKPFGNEARIAAPDTDIPLTDGAIGEIQIRGANVTPGYHNAPLETWKAFTRDGWLRTGDLGYRDKDGYYHVTGRIKELIIKGGENISPREIDEALLRHPAVLEAAAVGVPDPNYGQEIEAAVVLCAGTQCTEAHLINFCRDQLGGFKTPARIHQVTALPKGPSGKVQRLKLLAYPEVMSRF
ncbi:AMP-binding protein [Ectothiorhodospira lacustris]|uniref:AMP-binding protein n=1 Tax=Ectothiorhodospira lacustris TaxID=2899127 RepID=UPI001EE84391|nr:AMP-binding protein [Ectothiorhodospira lacustris]MCG5501335.1 AMP-binding protein [Ectothiorhodospira lacustris]